MHQRMAGLAFCFAAFAMSAAAQIVFPANGNINTIVNSSGTAGHAGDGGQATAAGLYLPSAVVVGPSGNLYIADYKNSRIQMVTAKTGIITTVAGLSTGGGGFAGDGGLATSAMLAVPQGVAVDSSGDIFIADTYNHRIRMVEAPGGNGYTSSYINSVAGGAPTAGYIYTIAGNGTAGFAGDGGLANSTSAELHTPVSVAVETVNGIEYLYIAEFANYRVRVVNLSTGIISTVAGQSTHSTAGVPGPAGSAYLYAPGGVALDPSGNLYIADTHNSRILEVTASTSSSTSSIPSGVANSTGTISLLAGKVSGSAGYQGDGGLATSALLNLPDNIALDSVGNLYITEESNCVVRKVTLSTGIITTVAGAPTTPDTATTAGAPYCGFSGDGGLATSAALNIPTGIAVDSSGNIYVDDYNNNRTRAFVQIKSTPTITWTAPAAITYGTALSATQLNASFSVPGSCVYTPASGTVLSQGTQTLSVTCTPTDTANINTVTATVSLTISAFDLSSSISACVNTTTGVVRIVGSTSLCVAGETGTTWAVTGPTGPQGPPVTFRGAWAAATAYAIGDAVSENGSSYIAVAANNNVDPAGDVAGLGANWALLAAKGATGAVGPQGATGLTGATGARGATGPQGPSGGAANIAAATTGQPAVYTSSTTIGGAASLGVNAGGTGATTGAGALANLVSAAGGAGPCPGVVNDTRTDNTAALNACIATGQAYTLPTNCQGSFGQIQVAGQLNSGTLGNNVAGTTLIGGGMGNESGCYTTIRFSGTTAATSGFAFSCANNSNANWCFPSVNLQNMNIYAANGSSGTGIAMTGTSASHNGDMLEMNNVYIWGFAQCLTAQGYGNGYLGNVACNGGSNSSGLFLVDIAGGSANSWIIDKLMGGCVKSGTPTAAGMLRLQSGIGNKVYLGDVDNCANVVTLGIYSGSSWQASMSEIWLGDDENPTGPLVVVGANSQAAVHWLGLQGTNNNTTSSPFVMKGNGALTLYNPPGGFTASTPYPLVTKGSNDMVTVIGGSLAPVSSKNNLGSIVQDSSGNQYFAGTPLTEVPSGALPAASLYTRFRCFGGASTSGADTIECGYQTATGTYAYTPNLAQAVTSTDTSNLTLAAATAATNGANQSSSRLYFNGNAYSTVNSGSYSTGYYLQNVLTNTAQSPVNTLTLGTAQSGGLTGTYAVDFSSATGGFKAAGLTDTGVKSATVLGTNSSGVVAAASTTGSGNVVLATSPIVSGLTDTGSTHLTNLIVSGTCTGCGSVESDATAATAAASTLGPAGNGLLVKDANGNVVGTLLGNPSGATFSIYKSGYIVSVNIDGTFPPAHIWWSNSASCNGTPYLNDGNSGLGGIPTYAKTIVWSGTANSFYIPSWTSVNSVVTSVGAGAANPSIEKPDTAAGSYECDTNSSASIYGGWTLSSFDPTAALGWTLTTCTVLANGVPQSESCLAGPLQLP